MQRTRSQAERKTRKETKVTKNAGKIMKGSGYGAIIDIVVGIIGAIVGGFIMRLPGFSGQGGMIYTIIVAVIGAVILTWLIRLIKKA